MKEKRSTSLISVKTLVLLPIISTILFSVWISIYTPPPTDFGTGSMFDKIASRYDLVNKIIALNLDKSWRQTMVNELLNNLEIQGGKKQPKILDLATGTADVAILLGETILKKQKYTSNKNKNVILGIDPSSNMIEIGKSKVSSKNLDDIITLQIGDARDLSSLKSNSFDAVTMSFGIRNVPERSLALCEIHRLLKKKSGKLYVLEFSEPDGNSIMSFFARQFIRYVVPVLGAVLSGAPREYIHLQNSIKEFPSPLEFVKEIENVSCSGSGKKASKKNFRVEKVNHMNYGSVQLYVATSL